MLENDITAITISELLGENQQWGEKLHSFTPRLNLISINIFPKKDGH